MPVFLINRFFVFVDFKYINYLILTELLKILTVLTVYTLLFYKDQSAKI